MEDYKYRHEYKYVCDSGQIAVLKSRVEHLLRRDPHVSENGSYRIRSLYFDTLEDICYYDNENGVNERCKFRIRIYDADRNYITLEKKVKQRQMGYKQKCLITEAECRELMRGKIPVLPCGESETKSRLFRELQRMAMRPKVIVEYVRYPYVEEASNVRVTFDKQISSSCYFGNFLDEHIASRAVNLGGMGILEVKWDAFLPDYIRQTLQLDGLRHTGYSKYYFCRKFNLYGGVRL